jgi:DNA repair protein RadA/Sms
MASGVDQGRLSLLLAVLEKRAGLPLFSQDVYINVAGGLDLSEPAADLALCAAVASSARGAALDGSLAVMGEVGLAGEVRAVPQAERRLIECARLGFTKIVLPKANLRGLKSPEGASLYGVETLQEALHVIMKK